MKHRAFCLLVLLLLASACGAQAATTTYAATTLGLYKSTDGGATWQSIKVSVSASILQGLPVIGAIAIDPLNPAVIHFLGAVSGTTAFFNSTDSGQTWSAGLLPEAGGIGGTQPSYWLCIDPVATKNLYLLVSGKFFRSSDNGVTWTTLPGPGGTMAGIATDPVTSGVLYATSSFGVISKSTDFGNTWTTLAKLVYHFTPTTRGIFVDPNNNQRLWVGRVTGQPCLDANGSPIDCGLFRSQDGGQTWARITLTGPTGSVSFDRKTGDIYVGGIWAGIGTDVAKSSDQGNTWNYLGKVFGGVNDGPNVSVDPGAAGVVYAFGFLNVFEQSTDGGATWKNVTLPRYCTASPPTTACPSSLQGAPQVYAMTYVPPPPPPAVSVATTVSAASLQPGPVAAESIVIATGSHIATGSATGDYDQPPVTLAGTTINVTDSAGVTRPAVIFSINATQVTYQIPPGTAAGPATVTITAGDGVTGSVQVQVAAVAPGLYTLNSSGLAKAYVVRISNGNQTIEDVYDIDATGAVIARPITVSNGGQVYLFVYGTGFRAAGGDIGATVGGIGAPVLFAGPQGVVPGLDQFNILIPPEVATGGPLVVGIVLTAAGQTANTVYVTIQ